MLPHTQYSNSTLPHTLYSSSAYGSPPSSGIPIGIGGGGSPPVPLYYNLNQGLPFQPSSMPDYQQPLQPLPDEAA